MARTHFYDTQCVPAGFDSLPVGAGAWAALGPRTGRALTKNGSPRYTIYDGVAHRFFLVHRRSHNCATIGDLSV